MRRGVNHFQQGKLVSVSAHQTLEQYHVMMLEDMSYDMIRYDTVWQYAK